MPPKNSTSSPKHARHGGQARLDNWLTSSSTGRQAASAASTGRQAANAAPTREEPRQTQDAAAVLRRVYGYSAFRPQQLEAIESVTAKADTLVLMPTGGGKTLCYVVSALMLHGLALVVSPLIALMQDQVAALKERNVACELLCSSQTAEERRRVLAAARAAAGTGTAAAADTGGLPAAHDQLKLLFVTPEFLASKGGESLLSMLASNQSASLLAVDEAHCISSWGHDFRPAYAKLGRVREQLERGSHRVPIVALTATANLKVQQDIASVLRFRPPSRTICTSFNRPNIRYRAVYLTETKVRDLLLERRHRLQRAAGKHRPAAGDDDDVAAVFDDDPAQLVHEAKIEAMMPLLRQLLVQRPSGVAAAAGSASGGGGAAVVYTLRKQETAAVAASLCAEGVKAAHYHAGLPAAQREQVLSEFLDGTIHVVAATVAFGMGIDKANVRLVCHYSMPKSLEAFYQESGRGGRDGAPCASLVLLSPKDVQVLRFIADRSDQQQQSKNKKAAQQNTADGDSRGGGGSGSRGRDGASAGAGKSVQQLRGVEQLFLGGRGAGVECFRKHLLQFFETRKSVCSNAHGEEQCDVCRLPQGAVKKQASLMQSEAGGYSFGCQLGTRRAAFGAVESIDFDDAVPGSRGGGGDDEEDSYNPAQARQKRARLEARAEAMQNMSVRDRVRATDALDVPAAVCEAPGVQQIPGKDRMATVQRVTALLAKAPDGLQEGNAREVAEAVDAWAFANCKAKHEYYTVVRSVAVAKAKGGKDGLSSELGKRGIHVDLE